MKTIIRRFFLILLIPPMLIGFSTAAFVWWVLEDDFDKDLGIKIFMDAWDND